MKGNIEKEGHYELFETTKGNEVLVLNNKDWYAIVEGRYGHILVKSDDDHKKRKSIQEGTFYLANFEKDPEFRDVPHLFLQNGNKYNEFVLPNDFPTENDKQKKLIEVKDKVSEEKVMEHVKAEGKAEQKEETATAGRKPVSGSERKSLQSLSREDLMDLARIKKVKNRSKMKKEELIASLKNAK